MTDGYDNIKHMTHRMGERAPTAQDKIKRRINGMKEHITGGYDNIKHMTNDTDVNKHKALSKSTLRHTLR
jgi:hypothetical protein